MRCAVLGEPQPGFIARDDARGHGPEGKWTYGSVEIGKLARRSEGKGATDRTKYGGTRISASKFYVHHSQMLSKAVRLQWCMMRRPFARGSHASSKRSARPRRRLTVACARKPSVAVCVSLGAAGSPLVVVCVL